MPHRSRRENRRENISAAEHCVGSRGLRMTPRSMRTLRPCRTRPFNRPSTRKRIARESGSSGRIHGRDSARRLLLRPRIRAHANVCGRLAKTPDAHYRHGRRSLGDDSHRRCREAPSWLSPNSRKNGVWHVVDNELVRRARVPWGIRFATGRAPSAPYSHLAGKMDCGRASSRLFHTIDADDQCAASDTISAGRRAYATYREGLDQIVAALKTESAGNAAAQAAGGLKGQ